VKLIFDITGKTTRHMKCRQQLAFNKMTLCVKLLFDDRNYIEKRHLVFLDFGLDFHKWRRKLYLSLMWAYYD